MYPTALQTLFPALLSGFCFIGFLSPLVSILTSTLFSMLMFWPFGKGFSREKEKTVHYNASYWSLFIFSTTYFCSPCVILEPERGKSLLWTPDSHVSMSTFPLHVLLGPCAVLPDFHAVIDLNTTRNHWALCHSILRYFNTLLSYTMFSRNQAALDVKGDFKKSKMALKDTGFTEVEAHLKIQLIRDKTHLGSCFSDYVSSAA